MSESKYGYLAKLRALRDMKGTTNAHNVSRHLDVTYECARSGLRRMEAAGLVIGARTGTDRWRPEVVYSLTPAGVEALARGVELSLGPNAKAPTPATRKPRGEASTGANPAWDWRGLHEALSMGDAPKPKKARKVRFALDTEPSWRYGA
jgi:predicted ArsR family transcriptional regulator